MSFCEKCTPLMLLLWEVNGFYQEVLWDGKNTYWDEEMQPSAGYEDLILGELYEMSESRFTFIGFV